MKAEQINTLEEAEQFCEGVLNDFETGICNKAETMKQLSLYTGRLNDLFWENSKKVIRANPALLGGEII